MIQSRLLVCAMIVAGLAFACFLAVSASSHQPGRNGAKASESHAGSNARAGHSGDLVVPEVSSPALVPIERNDFSLRESLAKAIAEAEELTDPARYEIRAETWQRLVTNLSSRELETVFRELNALQKANPTDSGRDLQLRVLQRYCEYDVRAAAAVMAEMPIADRPEACERVASQWARQNLGDAVAWVRQLGEAAERQRALTGVAAEAVSDHPAEVLALASEISLPPERHDLIAQAASCWASTAPQSALNWTQHIPDSPLRQEVLAAVAVAWADQDAGAAAKLVINSLPAGPGQDNAVMGIVQRLARKNRESTRAWVTQFPAGPLRERAELELNRMVERHIAN